MTATPQQAEHVIKRYVPWVVATALFMEQLDSTIINTAVPAMAESLRVTPLSLKAVVTSYILSVILIDSATKEQVIGDVSFENATASANGKVTVTLAAAPSNPILVIITSIAL